MQQLQDVSQQLSRYVADVESLEGENDELRVQLEELKSQLGKERALVKDTFLQAKQVSRVCRHVPCYGVCCFLCRASGVLYSIY